MGIEVALCQGKTGRKVEIMEILLLSILVALGIGGITGYFWNRTKLASKKARAKDQARGELLTQRGKDVFG